MFRYGAYIGQLDCKLSDFHKVAHPDKKTADNIVIIIK